MKNFSPNLVILVIVVILVVGAVAIFINRQQNPAMISNSDISTPSDNPTLAASAQNSATTEADLEYIESYNSGAPLPTPNPLTEYIYPGAKVILRGENKIEMTSTQSNTKITDWYKDIIEEFGFNAKSFSQTNTSGVVYNKLSAAKPGEKIEVTIKKDQTTSTVAITVDRP